MLPTHPAYAVGSRVGRVSGRPRRPRLAGNTWLPINSLRTTRTLAKQAVDISSHCQRQAPRLLDGDGAITLK